MVSTCVVRAALNRRTGGGSSNLGTLTPLPHRPGPLTDSEPCKHATVLDISDGVTVQEARQGQLAVWHQVSL